MTLEWTAVTALIALGGMILTIVRNGKSQAKRDGALSQQVTEVVKKLDDPDTGLGATNRSINEMKTHCAAMTSGFDERIKALKERVDKED